MSFVFFVSISVVISFVGVDAVEPHRFETLVILTVELYGSSRQMKMFEQTKSVMMC